MSHVPCVTVLTFKATPSDYSFMYRFYFQYYVVFLNKYKTKHLITLLKSFYCNCCNFNHLLYFSSDLSLPRFLCLLHSEQKMHRSNMQYFFYTLLTLHFFISPLCTNLLLRSAIQLLNHQSNASKCTILTNAQSAHHKDQVDNFKCLILYNQNPKILILAAIFY